MDCTRVIQYPPVSESTFRNAMSKLVGSVHIVTSTGFSGDVGMTATAVCPISLVPPTLLVCLNQHSRTHDVAIASGVLSVNVLSDDQEALAEEFGVVSGGDMSARFASARWSRGSTGAPLLDGCAVALDCRVDDDHQVGTHSVLFCTVVDVTAHEKDGVLLYGARRYASYDLTR
ncbi:FMN reductase (NADH) RutF [Paraburkholderia kururiensis]